MEVEGLLGVLRVISTLVIEQLPETQELCLLNWPFLVPKLSCVRSNAMYEGRARRNANVRMTQIASLRYNGVQSDSSGASTIIIM